jgi:hypothetical protein
MTLRPAQLSLLYPQAVGARPQGHGGGTRAIHPRRARHAVPAIPRPASARGPRRWAAHLRWCDAGRCATRRGDEMSGKLHSPFQVGDEPLGRSVRRMHFWGEIAGLKRYWCGAMQAAKKPGLAQRSHGECKQSGFQPTGKPYPWHIISCIQWTYDPLNMGQRMHSKVIPRVTEAGYAPLPAQRISQNT